MTDAQTPALTKTRSASGTELIVENASPYALTFGSWMIPAGETRIFTRDQVPETLWPAVAEASPEAPAEPEGDPIAELLANDVAEVLPMLAALDDAELDRVEDIELAKRAEKRDEILEAVAKEKFKRTQEAAGEEVA